MKNKITPEKRRALDKAAFKFLAKNLWTGIHHGLMGVAMTFILLMDNLIYFGDSDFIRIVGSLAIGVFIIRRVLRVSAENFKKLNEELKSIIEAGSDNDKNDNGCIRK